MGAFVGRPVKVTHRSPIVMGMEIEPDAQLAWIDAAQQSLHRVRRPTLRPVRLPAAIGWIGLNGTFALAVFGPTHSVRTIGQCLLVVAMLAWYGSAVVSLPRLRREGTMADVRRCTRAGELDLASNRYPGLIAGGSIGSQVELHQWLVVLAGGAIALVVSAVLFRPWLASLERPPRRSKPGRAPAALSPDLHTLLSIRIAAVLALVTAIEAGVIARVLEVSRETVDAELERLSAAGVVKPRRIAYGDPVKFTKLTSAGRAGFRAHVVALESYAVHDVVAFGH